jgi:ubiquitin-protein ligase
VRRADCKNDKTSGIALALVDDNPFHLIGTFPGPEGTPYEGGLFDVVRPLSFPRLRAAHATAPSPRIPRDAHRTS